MMDDKSEELPLNCFHDTDILEHAIQTAVTGVESVNDRELLFEICGLSKDGEGMSFLSSKLGEFIDELIEATELILERSLGVYAFETYDYDWMGRDIIVSTE
jgi:hypothetical protein